ncbi:hypothetical protein ES708_13897 [subsurface metagenome]
MLGTPIQPSFTTESVSPARIVPPTIAISTVPTMAKAMCLKRT